jgi:hypothetical protein
MSPYARFNLRRNPFGELTRQERAELAVVDMAPWLELLGQPDAAIQFLGPRGNGKTTHLLALERSLPSATYVYLPEDEPLPPIPDQRPLLIDEAQRLTASQRRRAFRVGGPLALGTHDDLNADLRRYGFTRVITVDVARTHSPHHLADLLNRRIEASRLGNASVPRVDLTHAVTLLRNWGTNIRQIEQHLYDQFQDAVHKGLPWPPAN